MQIQKEVPTALSSGTWQLDVTKPPALLGLGFGLTLHLGFSGTGPSLF